MNILEMLKKSEHRKALNEHSLIKRMRSEEFNRDQVAAILGQWYHPLHYFPSFVSRFIGITPSLEVKTMMSKIVWQELGEGDTRRAHERIFETTMQDVGFKKEDFIDVAPLNATKKLVDEYEAKSANAPLDSLGYVYATEAADLLMVSSIGSSVRRTTGVRELPWVDIHVKQEPDHTDSVDGAVKTDFSPEELDTIVKAAEKMFGLWCDFFSNIEIEVDKFTHKDMIA